MKRVLRHFWPSTLAGRLTLFLVLSLAIAQAGLAVLLNSQRDLLVTGLTHSQSLNQTVTLTRLLDQYPDSEASRLLAAFGSRQSCAWISTTPPVAHAMSDPEEELAEVLSAMLHGVRAGNPVVLVEQSALSNPCQSVRGDGGGSTDASSSNTEHDGDEPGYGDVHVAALTMNVPLENGSWLAVHTRVEIPGDFDRNTLITFLLSSLAVAVVATLVVRRETRSLRALADASERLGRGETVQTLPAIGPEEVSAATRAFNTMQHRLGEFLRDRVRLLASISHDLKTPITTLRLKAEFIEDEAVRDDLIKTIEELATICEATLAFTRSEAIAEDTKVIDLVALVHEVAEESRLAGKPVDEQRMDAARCPCRPVALKRAIRNLVENAERYGYRAHVSVISEGELAIVRIDDEGPGIPRDQIEEAFQPFVRLEPSRNPETGGIGLGLAIARSIVTAHGGAINLSNLPEKGLRAELSLPILANSGSRRAG